MQTRLLPLFLSAAFSVKDVFAAPVAAPQADFASRLTKGIDPITPTLSFTRIRPTAIVTGTLTLAPSILPSLTPIDPIVVPCGCHNSCTLGCKRGDCICPMYCDPKYECRYAQQMITAVIENFKRDLPTSKGKPGEDTAIYKATLSKITTLDEPTPLPSVDPVNPKECGCYNPCRLTCPPDTWCNCPQECDPRYACGTLIPEPVTTRPNPSTRPVRPTLLPTITISEASTITLSPPSPVTFRPSSAPTVSEPILLEPLCDVCTNDCFLRCPKGENCICPLYCDAKYLRPCSSASPVKATLEPIHTLVYPFPGEPVETA